MKKIFLFLLVLTIWVAGEAFAEGASAPNGEEVVVTMSLETVR